LNHVECGKTLAALSLVPFIHSTKKDKLLYKKRIREEQVIETSHFTNDLHEALQRKSGQEFWKVWKSKFPNASTDLIQVDGVADCAVIATKFAKHFELVCKSVNTHNEDLKPNIMHSEHNTADLS